MIIFSFYKSGTVWSHQSRWSLALYPILDPVLNQLLYVLAKIFTNWKGSPWSLTLCLFGLRNSPSKSLGPIYKHENSISDTQQKVNNVEKTVFSKICGVFIDSCTFGCLKKYFTLKYTKMYILKYVNECQWESNISIICNN